MILALLWPGTVNSGLLPISFPPASPHFREFEGGLSHINECDVSLQLEAPLFSKKKSKVMKQMIAAACNCMVWQGITIRNPYLHILESCLLRDIEFLWNGALYSCFISTWCCVRTWPNSHCWYFSDLQLLLPRFHAVWSHYLHDNIYNGSLLFSTKCFLCYQCMVVCGFYKVNVKIMSIRHYDKWNW